MHPYNNNPQHSQIPQQPPCPPNQHQLPDPPLQQNSQEPPYYTAFLQERNGVPSSVVPYSVKKKTIGSRPKVPSPVPSEARKTKTPPTPRTSQKKPLPQKRPRSISSRVKIVLALVAVLLLAIGGLTSYLMYSNFTHPARTVVQSFYKAMEQRNYQQAFSYVSKNGLRGSFLALSGNDSHYYSNAGDFANACKAIDKQKGQITNFSITGFNATFNLFNDPVTASVTVTRGKQSYTANIGLVQEGQSWKIDYVDNL